MLRREAARAGVGLNIGRHIGLRVVHHDVIDTDVTLRVHLRRRVAERIDTGRVDARHVGATVGSTHGIATSRDRAHEERDGQRSKNSYATQIDLLAGVEAETGASRTRTHSP